MLDKSKIGLLATCTMFMLLTTQPAAAAETFQFDIATVNNWFSFSGTLATSSTTTLVDGRQAYTVTGISGTVNGLPVDGLLPAGSNHFIEKTDNYLFADDRYVTPGGLGFASTDGQRRYYLFLYDNAYQVGEIDLAIPNVLRFDDGPLSIFHVNSAVPEPASWAMMLVGFCAVGSAMRRRPKVVARLRIA